MSGTTLTFSTAPTGAITVGFNSEIDLGEDVPVAIQLAANGNNADTGFSVITTQHNIVIMDYTLESTNGVRVGQLKFATDTSASTSTIDDIFTETGAVGIVFNLDIGTAVNTHSLV